MVVKVKTEGCISIVAWKYGNSGHRGNMTYSEMKLWFRFNITAVVTDLLQWYYGSEEKGKGTRRAYKTPFKGFRIELRDADTGSISLLDRLTGFTKHLHGLHFLDGLKGKYANHYLIFVKKGQGGLKSLFTTCSRDINFSQFLTTWNTHHLGSAKQKK